MIELPKLTVRLPPGEAVRDWERTIFPKRSEDTAVHDIARASLLFTSTRRVRLDRPPVDSASLMTGQVTVSLGPLVTCRPKLLRNTPLEDEVENGWQTLALYIFPSA